MLACRIANTVKSKTIIEFFLNTVWELEEVRAGDHAKAPAGVSARAEVLERAKAGGLKILNRTQPLKGPEFRR